jgi:hypothetical protein
MTADVSTTVATSHTTAMVELTLVAAGQDNIHTHISSEIHK